MKVTPLQSKAALCIGDALREIDQQHIIRHDFILITSDIVSNCKLGDLIAQHKSGGGRAH